MTIKLLLAAILALPTYKEDRPVTPEKERQLSAISSAIVAAARTPDEAAFLIALGQHESGFSLRIHEGRCRPTECDRGRARGVWQVHRTAAMTDAQWDRMVGVDNVLAQSGEAARRVRWALNQCKTDRIRGAFAVLGGLRCDGKFRGIDERVKTFESVRRRLP